MHCGRAITALTGFKQLADVRCGKRIVLIAKLAVHFDAAVLLLQ